MIDMNYLVATYEQKMCIDCKRCGKCKELLEVKEYYEKFNSRKTLTLSYRCKLSKAI